MRSPREAAGSGASCAGFRALSGHPSACLTERKSQAALAVTVRWSEPMSFVAQTERTIAAPPQRVFDTLANVASWPAWMPRTFAPVADPALPSPLRIGDRFRVKVGGAPFASTLKISKLERPREIAWRGGIRGVLWAEHRFVLEPDGDRGTRVRSIETWHGALAGVLRRLVEPAAVRIGGQQLDGLANAASTAATAN